MKSSPVLSTPHHSTRLYETDCEFSCNLLTRFTTAYVYMFFVSHSVELVSAKHELTNSGADTRRSRVR